MRRKHFNGGRSTSDAWKGILVVVIVIVIIAITATLAWLRYEECIEEGYGRFMCIELISR